MGAGVDVYVVGADEMITETIEKNWFTSQFNYSGNLCIINLYEIRTLK